jgi:hypothetical protein
MLKILKAINNIQVYLARYIEEYFYAGKYLLNHRKKEEIIINLYIIYFNLFYLTH